METENTISGKAFFCYKESMNVDMKSNHSKVRIESLITGQGTSSKMQFDGQFKYGELRQVTLELLNMNVLEDELTKKLPLLLTFSPSMPFGLFIPD